MSDAYHDFEVTFSGRTAEGYGVTVRSPAGNPRGVFVPPDEALTDGWTKANPQQLMMIGRALFGALFRDDVQRAYYQSQPPATPTRVRIVLNIAPEDTAIAALPWELLAEPRGNPLVLHGIPIVRTLPQVVSGPEFAASPPLRVLLTAAQTDPPANIERELHGVYAALKTLGDAVQITIEAHLTIDTLRARLHENFHVWHFVGHGDMTVDGSVLYFEDKGGDSKPISADTLQEHLVASDVRLVVLDSCSGADVSTSMLQSVAPALIRAAVPVVIAMQAPVTEETARVFACELYKALASGLAVDACVTDGRRAIKAAGETRNADWAIPVVYSRAPGISVVKQSLTTRQAPDVGYRHWSLSGNRRALLLTVLVAVLLLITATLGAWVVMSRQVSVVNTPIASPLTGSPAIPRTNSSSQPSQQALATVAPTRPADAATRAPSILFSQVISGGNAREVTQLARLGKGEITDISLSEDGTTLAVANPYGIYLYDAHTLNELWFFSTEQPVYAVAFSSAKGVLASARQGKAVDVWDITSHRILRTFDSYTKDVNTLAFSPDGHLLASGGENTIWLQDTNSGEVQLTIETDQIRVDTLAFSPDGRMLAAAGINNAILLWNVTTGALQQTLTGHTSWATSIAFGADGHTLVSSGLDNTARIWDTSTAQMLQTIEIPIGNSDGIALSPDGQLVAIASYTSVQLRQRSTGELVRRLDGHTDMLLKVLFSPDGQTLLTAGHDGTIRLWDVETGKPLHTSEGFSSGIQSIAISADGRTVVAGGGHLGGSLQVWDAIAGRHLRSLPGHTSWVGAVTFSPDGSTIASGASDGSVRLWDAATGQMLNSFATSIQYIHSIAFSPDGRLLAFCGGLVKADTEIQLWDLSTNQLLRKLEGHEQSVSSIVFSPDGQTLASASYDHTVRLWDINTALEVRTLTGHGDGVGTVVFSHDGHILASTGGYNNSSIILWDVMSGEQMRTFRDSGGNVSSITFTPDDRILAIGGDNTIRLLDTANGNILRTLEGHRSDVKSVVISPDGRILLSGSVDGTIGLWGISDTNR